MYSIALEHVSVTRWDNNALLDCIALIVFEFLMLSLILESSLGNENYRS